MPDRALPPETRAPARTLLLFAAGCALGALLAVAVARVGAAPRDRAQPEALPVLAAGFERLERVLGRLDARLGSLERAAAERASSARPPAPGDPLHRVPAEPERAALPAGPSLEELAAQLRELRALVQTCIEAAREDPAQRLQSLREAHPDANWAELQALLDLHATDEEAARRAVHLASRAAILERFGSPHMIYGGEGSVHWVYGRDYLPASDSYRLQIVLRFVDGVVTQLFVERA